MRNRPSHSRAYRARRAGDEKNRKLQIKATGLGTLLAALKAREGYIGNHSQAVVELPMAVARWMGLSEEEIADVEQAALLHDVG